jgi:hypothetical protein
VKCAGVKRDGHEADTVCLQICSTRKTQTQRYVFADRVISFLRHGLIKYLRTHRRSTHNIRA